MTPRVRLFFFRTQLICGFTLTILIVFSLLDHQWWGVASMVPNAGLQFWMASDNYGKLSP